MPNYYLDLETTGVDPGRDRIITIQWQELDIHTGKARGPLTILKEWESSEHAILQAFIEKTRITDPYPFSFVPVGYNLGFDHNFLIERTALHGLARVDILSKPFIDLRPMGILMNRGAFKGSGLDKLTGKPGRGDQVPRWYARKEYDRILAYIQEEARAFAELNAWLYQELPRVLERFKKRRSQKSLLPRPKT